MEGVVGDCEQTGDQTVVDGEGDVGGGDGDVRQRREHGEARVGGDGGAQREEWRGKRRRQRNEQLVAHPDRGRRHRCAALPKRSAAQRDAVRSGVRHHQAQATSRRS